MSKRSKILFLMLLGMTFGVLGFAAGIVFAEECPANPDCDPIEIVPAPPCPPEQECDVCPDCPPDLPQPQRKIYQQRCPGPAETEGAVWEELDSSRRPHPFRWDLMVDFAPEGNAAAAGVIWNRWHRFRPMVRVSHDFDEVEDVEFEFCKHHNYGCTSRSVSPDAPDETRVWLGAVIGLGRAR